jgi:hypothetical protein
MTETEPDEEVWTYAGVRIGARGTRVHAWLDAQGEELRFAKTGTHAAVGSLYTVNVARHGDTISIHGAPAYTGRATDDQTRQQLWTEHTTATTRLQMIRSERTAARRNALDEAIAPLLELARPLRTAADRDALAAYVIRKLHNTWT